MTGAIWAAAVDWDDWGVWGGGWDGGDIDFDCNDCFNNRDFNGKLDFNDVDWKNIDRSKININQHGVVYETDLGPATGDVVKYIELQPRRDLGSRRGLNELKPVSVAVTPHEGGVRLRLAHNFSAYAGIGYHFPSTISTRSSNSHGWGAM